MNEPEKQEDTIRKEVLALTDEQRTEQLIRWMIAIPKIAKMTQELSHFKRFAKNGDELSTKITNLTQTFQAEIERREIQIEQLSLMIKQYSEDPIGVGFQLNEMANSKSKLH